jgi:hypothetical protein
MEAGAESGMTGGSHRDEDERLRTAYHECGHVAAAHMLRGPVGLVSIGPRCAWGGIARAGARRYHPGELERTDFEAPLALWPPRVRCFLEGRMLILLAGSAAERLVPVFMPDGYLPAARCEARAAEQVARLSRRDRMFLARGDEREPDPARRDEAKAVEDAQLLAPEAAGRLLEHLRCEAYRLTAMPRFQRLVSALVPALLAAEDLPGAAVRRILREADSL